MVLLSPFANKTVEISPSFKIPDFIGPSGRYKEGGHKAPVPAPMSAAAPPAPGFEALSTASVFLVASLLLLKIKRRRRRG